MVSKVTSFSVIGLDAEPISVEVDLARGLPSFTIVGLPDKAVEEAKERVRSAIKNSGIDFPQGKITVNLAPADIRKEGPAYDLPIAIGILVASEKISLEDNNDVFLGELSLSGDIRKVTGVLPIALEAKKRKFDSIYLPKENADEASLAEGLKVYPSSSLRDIIRHFRKEREIDVFSVNLQELMSSDLKSDHDMANIKGQDHAKRALEIAAAGAHNISLSGPPGSGKTLLAKAFSSILPKMTMEEILEVTKIYSVAGLLNRGNPLVIDRPIRAPHHTASNISLIGGGKWPKPGEISLAHRGALFLDEFPEFPRSVLEVLRQPLEDNTITISRATGTLTFPAKFILIAAQNPCPCGFLSDPRQSCNCSPAQIIKYNKKISGPLMDRIDLHIEVPRLKFEKLENDNVSESSEKIKTRVEKAREIQQKRFKNFKIMVNSEMANKEIKEFCLLDEKSKELVRQAVNQLNLSARAYHKILKIARTIADLDNSPNIKLNHIAEALQYRPKNNN